MARLGELLDRMTITASSPDGRIEAELRDRRSLRIRFPDPDDYSGYGSATALAGQVSALLTDLMLARLAAVKHAVETATGQPVTEEPHWDARRRRYRERRDAMAAHGLSDDGLIEIEGVGLREFRVDVDPETLDELDASGFCGAVRSAFADLWKNHGIALRRLQQEYAAEAGE